jgi:hypothetical protein
MMTPFPKNILERLAAGLYRALLYGYPKEFRKRYGLEMNQVFRAQMRDMLSSRGILGFAFFCMRTAWDSFTSILRERLTLQTIFGMVCLCAALGFSIYAHYVDHHNATEVYPTLMVVLVGSFILGVANPAHPWRWAIILAVGVPFFGPWQSLPARLHSPGGWAIVAVLLVPGLVGAYVGSILRRTAGASGDTPEQQTPAPR